MDENAKRYKGGYKPRLIGWTGRPPQKMLERRTGMHAEHPPRAWMLAGVLARMLAEACERTNIHTEEQARITEEACARILAKACAQIFLLRVRASLLRVQACTEACARILLLKAQACMEAHPRKFPR